MYGEGFPFGPSEATHNFKVIGVGSVRDCIVSFI